MPEFVLDSEDDRVKKTEKAHGRNLLCFRIRLNKAKEREAGEGAIYDL